jgi:hypothetical protein
MPMAMQDRPPRRYAVDYTASIRELEKFILCADTYERLIGPDKRSIGMPNATSVFGEQISGQR